MPRDTEADREQFQSALMALANEESLTTEQLDALSVPEGADLERIREVWEALPAAARERLLRRLYAAATERLRLDFSRVNYLGLGDSDARVRLAAVESALEDESALLLDQLLELSSHDPEPRVRQAATEDLARFALLAELERLDAATAERIQAHLIGLARAADVHPGAAAAALAALGYFSGGDAADELTQGFQDERLRVAAIRGMGRSADPRWTDRLLLVLASEEPEERQEAISALVEIEDERAVPSIAELVDDPVQDVQLEAISALGVLGGDDAREALLYALKAASVEVREAAERALTELEGSENDDLNV